MYLGKGNSWGDTEGMELKIGNTEGPCVAEGTAGHSPEEENKANTGN